MFLEIVRDIRNGKMTHHGLISFEDMVKKHPFCLDLRGWAKGGRLNSRFGLSNVKGRFLYVKTDETNKRKLEELVNSL